MARFVDKTKITQNKITIPEAIRNMYNLKDGDNLEWHDDGKDKIMVKKEEEEEILSKRGKQ